MATSDMRVSENRQEYIENIGLIFLEESDAFIWQDFSGSKLVSPVLIKDILPEENNLILSPKEKIFPKFDRNKDLYFKANRKEMLFKSPPGEYKIGPKKVELPFPEKAFYLELRQDPRFPLKPSSEVFIGMKRFESGQAKGHFRGKIRDVSRGGIGLAAKFKEQHIFETDHLFRIDRVGQTVLEKAITARVVYNRPIKTQKQNDLPFYIGLELEEKLPPKVLATLSSA